jgi:hypothetical protein
VVFLLAGIAALLLFVRSAEVTADSLMASVEEARDTVSVQMREMASPGATACGLVPFGEVPNESASCASSALSNGKAFWVASQVRGDDSDLWDGVIGAVDGTLVSIRLDSSPHGQGALRKGQRYQTYGETRCDRLTIEASIRKAVGCESARSNISLQADRER